MSWSLPTSAPGKFSGFGSFNTWTEPFLHQDVVTKMLRNSGIQSGNGHVGSRTVVYSLVMGIGVTEE